MQRYILTLVLAIASLPIFASSLTDRADSAYQAEDYALAAQFYNQATTDDGTSSDLYYNLGNTYYRLGKNAQAILAYERALRLDPSNADARANLDYVNERIVDKKGNNGSFYHIRVRRNSFCSICQSKSHRCHYSEYNCCGMQYISDSYKWGDCCSEDVSG